MASHEVIDVDNGGDETPTVDVEMTGEIERGGVEIEDAAEEGDVEPKDIVEAEAIPARVTFIDYLKSPIVTIIVGSGEDQAILTAHQALLEQSPYLQEQLSTGEQSPTLSLHDEHLGTVGCLLEFLYTSEYFPKKLGDSRSLEVDPSVSTNDEDGEQLLKHARVYTLAQKLGVNELKTLAHSKIHRINSTAKGEINYARFVYGNTPRDDVIIRKPVAAFWAHRSHVLRHEAETEFRKMCLDYPEFGFDVLSLVLDQKERGKEKEHPHERSGRKRQRTSVLSGV